MRVLIANPVVGDAYGQERVVRQLTEGLERRGHEVFLLGDERGGEIPTCSEYRIVPRLTSLHIFHSRRDRNQANQTAIEFIDRIVPDVVHWFDQYNPWLTENVNGRYPSVFSAHTAAPTCPASHRLVKKNNSVCTAKSGWSCVLNHHRFGCLDFLQTPLHRMHTVNHFLLKRHSLQKVGAFIAISDYIRELLIADGFAPEKITRIYNPVQVKERASTARPLPSKLIVAASRLVPLKGIDYLIRAFARLQDKEAVLWLLGDGPSHGDLKTLVESLGISDRVSFKGACTHQETLSVMRGASFVAQTNVGPEAFGLSIAEAQALGVPAIVFDTPALNEIVLHEQTGYVVPSRDEKLLTERMDWMLKNTTERDKFGKNAKERAEKLFPTDTHVTETLGVYQKVLTAWKRMSAPQPNQAHRRVNV